MGIGIVAIASKETATRLVHAIPDACIIGTISRQSGAKRVILI
jgi:heptaprenylglyceryl phosphate synthase